MVSTRSGAVTTPGKPGRSTPTARTSRTLRSSRKTKTTTLPSTTWLALGDGVATATFVLLASLFGEAALVLTDLTSIPLHVSNLIIIVLGVLLHTPICTAFGGALYNPSHNVAMFINGLGTLRQHACRVAAQVGGSVLGARLAIVLIPDRLQQSFAGFGIGMRPGVLLWQGLLCELALALVLNVIVLWSLNANPYIAYWTLMGATLVLMVAGAELTGPSLNPAISVGWFVHFQGHALLEHVLVFWVAPMTGAVFAGLISSRFQPRKSKRVKTH